MRRPFLGSMVGFFVGASAIASSARAQTPLPPPAAQPPPAQYQPPPGQYQYPPPGYGQPPPPPGYGQPPPPNYYPPPPPGYGQPPPGYYPPPQQPYYQAPPPPRPPPAPVEPPEPPEPPTHCPKYSLWVGPRLGYMFYGLDFYKQRGSNSNETTGNLTGNGLQTQFDIGARISYRYIPYFFYEHGFMADGHRFEGTSTTTTSRFYGIGLRHVSGDVDSVSFLSDISFGLRELSMTRDGQTYTMSGLALMNLGLGAEIRAATLFSITPMVRLSAGTMTDSKGTVKFAPGHAEGGIDEPAYRNGESIADKFYVVISFGVGVHFDVFGK